MDKPKPTDTKKEHYVPRCLLRRFADANEMAFVYDKFKRTIFKSSIGNVAHENNFYDIPEDVVIKAGLGMDIDRKMMERAFHPMETSFDAVIEKLIRDAEEGRGFSDSQKDEFAVYVTIQMMRTKEFREQYKQVTEGILNKVMMPLFKQDHPEYANCDDEVTYCGDFWGMQQSEAIFDEEKVVALAKHLPPHIWFIGANQTNQPLYISDHPFVRKGHATYQGKVLSGLRSPGIEMMFPLSSTHLLVLLDRRAFKDAEHLDGAIVPLDGKDVQRANDLQVEQSYRWIYCERREFSQAEAFCRKNPGCRDPERIRVRVESTKTEVTFSSEQNLGK